MHVTPEQNNKQLFEDFTQYDLLFGLEKDRKKYRTEITQKLVALHAHKTHYVTVDEINQRLDARLLLKEDCSAIDLSDLDTPVRHHGGKLLRDLDFNPGTFTLETPRGHNKRLLLSCKAALHEPLGTIRFCLDQLQLDAVRNPDHEDYNGYTSEELRWAAHNWEDVKHHIVFYSFGHRVPCPWADTHPSLWLRALENEEQAVTPINKDRKIATTRLYPEGLAFLDTLVDMPPQRDLRAMKLPDIAAHTDEENVTERGQSKQKRRRIALEAEVANVEDADADEASEQESRSKRSLFV